MAKIFTNVGSSVVNNIPKNAYDTDFKKTSVVDFYNNSIYNSVSNVNGGKGLVENYYQSYGYTSLIGDISSYLIGSKDASHTGKSILSLFVPGVTKDSIGSFVLQGAGIALSNPFISNIIDTAIPNPMHIPQSTVKWQYIPSQLFLTTNPPPVYISPNNSSDLITSIISNQAASLLTSTVSSIANGGGITTNDFERAFGKGVATPEIIMMAKAGLKYTEAVAWFDPTRPKWSDRPGYYTYDRYIAYSDGQLTYSKAANSYHDTMLDRFNDIVNQTIKPETLSSLSKKPLSAQPNAPIPTNVIPNNANQLQQSIMNNNIDNAKSYQASLGTTVDKNTNPEQLYMNKPDIRKAVHRLGFPLYNQAESIAYNIPGGWNDAINIKDLIDDNSYTYENAEQRDLIDFKFEDISSIGRNNPVIILFRAAIKGLSDDWSPSWTDIKYLGRPDNFYIYSGYTRKISFDMDVYCNSKNEVVPQWRKLNRLAGMCYPVNYAGNRTMKSPIMRLTIGNLYRRVYGFFDSFGISIPDGALWDTDLGYQLPMMLTAKIGFTIMYETDNQGAPVTDYPHFNQGTLFPQPNGTGESIYGNRFADITDKTKQKGISDTNIPPAKPTTNFGTTGITLK